MSVQEHMVGARHALQIGELDRAVWHMRKAQRKLAKVSRRVARSRFALHVRIAAGVAFMFAVGLTVWFCLWAEQAR